MKTKKLFVAEEVYITVRDLSKSRDLMFKWKDWMNAWISISPGAAWRNQKDAVSQQAGRALKAQLKHGSIKKLARGHYQFSYSRLSSPRCIGWNQIHFFLPAHPLYGL